MCYLCPLFHILTQVLVRMLSGARISLRLNKRTVHLQAHAFVDWVQFQMNVGVRVSVACWLLVRMHHLTQRRQWHPTPVLLPGKSHGWRSLVDCNPWGHWGSDTTERVHFHFSLWCIGEGNGNPLQCSCLENPRDGGAWWAAVYGVTQSWTRLKRLSSSTLYYWSCSPVTPL